MSRERDLQDILDILAESPKASSQEIEERLAELASQRKLAATMQTMQIYEARLKRGLESEERVKKALESLDIVDSVRKTSQGDWEDLAARDLVVNFEGYQKVGIQVKSSGRGVKEFIGDGKEAREKLKARKLIVINGQENEDVIRNSFLNDLKGVDDYWRKRGEPILSPRLRSLLDSTLAVVHP